MSVSAVPDALGSGERCMRQSGRLRHSQTSALFLLNPKRSDLSVTTAIARFSLAPYVAGSQTEIAASPVLVLLRRDRDKTAFPGLPSKAVVMTGARGHIQRSQT